jgi:hypothetical protein
MMADIDRIRMERRNRLDRRSRFFCARWLNQETDMKGEMIPVRKDTHDEAMRKFLMGFTLLESAIGVSKGVNDDRGFVTFTTCAFQKLGEAAQLLCDMAD